MCIYIYIYIYICILYRTNARVVAIAATAAAVAAAVATASVRTGCKSYVHPVRIARIRLPRFVGLPGNLFLISGLTAALRFSKGWVRKDAILLIRTGCMYIGRALLIARMSFVGSDGPC